MSVESDALRILSGWYKHLPLFQDKLPSRGSVGAALVVLQRLRTTYTLDINSHVAEGEAQISGLSASSLRKVLREFGETRALSTTGGRTNRGARGAIAALLESLRPLRLELLKPADRNEILKAMQRHIVSEYISAFFKVKRVKATFEHGAATSKFVHAIIQNARTTGKAGAVAEYLVGAKLALCFPDQNIRNKRFSTADVQGGFSGDFEIGNTVFHVTIAPVPELFAKCQRNLEQGHRVYLLVPALLVEGARQNAELLATGKIAVEPIESFIATNIDELSDFDGDKLISGFRRFLEKYNERVDEVELDKSMLIEIPPNIE